MGINHPYIIVRWWVEGPLLVDLVDLLLQIIDNPEFEGGGLYCRHVLNFPNPNVFQDEKNGPRNKSLFVQCDPPQL